MNHQILVIDDSDKVHPLVRGVLASEKVDIHSATDPEYGLVLAASIKPDLILLDVDMPGMTGFEACHRLKANPETAECPVIFLTGQNTTKEKVQGFGVGAVDYITKPFSPTELLARVRASLKTHAAIRSLEARVLTDPLTGLWNRAMFNQRMNAEIASSARIQSPLSVIMIDIDHFKKINDLYGHPAGDQVLRDVATIIKLYCRVEDVACRYGGEEFAVIAPHTSAQETAVLAERIRASVAETQFKPAVRAGSPLAGGVLRVTVSLGVAAANDPHDRSMLQRADDAMYEAKQGGRNRVAISPSDAEPLRSAA